MYNYIFFYSNRTVIPNFCRIVFGVFFVLNLVLWSKGSSGAISFGILVALLALWFGISVPLTFVGAFFGFRKRVCVFKSINIFIILLYIWLYSLSNILFGPIRYHARFLIKVFIHVRLQELSWAVFCPLAASSFSYFSFSIPCGPIKCIICLGFFSWFSLYWS